MGESKSVAIIGAGIFGLSLAVALRAKNYQVTVFDQHRYDRTGYDPELDHLVQAASVDENKIFRASYGTKLHYQRLALESREGWLSLNETRKRELAGRDGGKHDNLFIECGMLRVQPTDELGALERETLANMERDGLRHTQFVKSDPSDQERAIQLGWDSKLLDFDIPDTSPRKSFEAVLDSLAGFTKCSEACAHFQTMAAAEGVAFRFGPQEGAFESLVEESIPTSVQKRVTGLKTRNGAFHKADVVVIAAGSFSTQLLPDLSYHLESSAGSIAKFKIDKENTELWDKYSPENFPIMTWKSAPRNSEGKDIGSVYVFPRTSEGVVKIGYRGIKFTNFQPAPKDAPFTQDNKWSIPLPAAESLALPGPAVDAIRTFVSIFLPEFKDVPFHSTKLCWYTDSLDNSFVIDYVPTYAERSVFVCTGGSGHGAKFLPVLGEHAADIFENGDQSSSYLRHFWCWRDEAPRGNGLAEGPSGPRNIGVRWKIDDGSGDTMQ